MSYLVTFFLLCLHHLLCRRRQHSYAPSVSSLYPPLTLRHLRLEIAHAYTHTVTHSSCL
jgi:hypothetical protein